LERCFFRAALACASVVLLVSPPVFAGPPASKKAKPQTAPVVPQPDRSSRGYHLAQTALAYRGTPYRWGGTTLGRGVDCSGLVMAVCKKWGILLPRAARAQYGVGTPVKPADLQPGDLVFFKNTYRRGLSHVGIYIGENHFIHAAGRGKGVRLSRIDVGYHKKHWAGARRLNLSKLPPVPGEQAPTPERIYLDSEEETTVPNGASSGSGSE
jgi:cell wall-associated NlpC family hydrolase